MKRAVAFLLCIILLSGCSTDRTLSNAVSLRNSLLTGDGCQFHAAITADYGDKVYTFGLQCEFDSNGKLTFYVTEPESIAGVSGTIHEGNGQLTFDEQVLAFELLADELLTPVSAPWIVVRALRSGYIHSVLQEKDFSKICIDDSYREDTLQINILVNAENAPYFAEIFWKSRRIISIQITNFVFQ